MLKTRNNSGGIVPLGSVATVQEVSGADKITRYNMFTAADLSGQPAPGASTGDALAAVERLAKEILPTSFTTDWTEIALQQKARRQQRGLHFSALRSVRLPSALGAL